MARLDVFNRLVDLDFLTIDAILVSLVVVALLSQLLPGGFGFLCDHFRTVELCPHFRDFDLHLGILVCDVRDKADSQVLERALLLKVEPFLLEGVHRLLHAALGEEVADEVVNDYRSLDRGRGGLLLVICSHRRLFHRRNACLRHNFGSLLLLLRLQLGEVFEIVIAFVIKVQVCVQISIVKVLALLHKSFILLVVLVIGDLLFLNNVDFFLEFCHDCSCFCSFL